MVDDLITRAEAALEGVTEGPWMVMPGAHGNVWQFPDEGQSRLIVHCGLMTPPNAEFIAAARSLVPELVAELKTTRAQLETLRAGLTRVEHFARIQALSERVRTGPAHSTYHCEERYWLDLLALIERAEVADV